MTPKAPCDVLANVVEHRHVQAAAAWPRVRPVQRSLDGAARLGEHGQGERSQGKRGHQRQRNKPARSVAPVSALGFVAGGYQSALPCRGGLGACLVVGRSRG